MGTEEIIKVCKDALEDDDLSWDYFEEGCHSPKLEDTAPGIIVLALEGHIEDGAIRRKVISLFVSYAARHGLLCWFAYCEDEKPYRTISKIINDLLLSDVPPTWSIDESDLQARVPMEKGRRIVDCRAEDTTCASEAVSQAARYVLNGSTNDAALALSSAFSAFNVSPVDSVYSFAEWLLDIALPAALELRHLPPDNRLPH